MKYVRDAGMIRLELRADTPSNHKEHRDYAIKATLNNDDKEGID